MKAEKERNDSVGPSSAVTCLGKARLRDQNIIAEREHLEI